MFKDRKHAAKILAEKLKKYKNAEGVVLAIPRGGVILGYELAKELNLPLEIMLTKKIGHPYNPEFSIGSVSLHGAIINPYIAIPKVYLDEVIKNARKILKERFALYMSGREPMELKDKTVIVVDDGIATGNTMLVIIDIIKKSNPAKIIVAVPVASPRVIEKIESKVDEVVCLAAPDDFLAVGQFYEDFSQVSDDEVIYLLNKANKREQKIIEI